VKIRKTVSGTPREYEENITFPWDGDFASYASFYLNDHARLVSRFDFRLEVSAERVQRICRTGLTFTYEPVEEDSTKSPLSHSDNCFVAEMSNLRGKLKA